MLLDLKLGFRKSDKVKIVSFWGMKKPFNRMAGNCSAQGRIHTEVVFAPNKIVFLDTDLGVVKLVNQYTYEEGLNIILYNVFKELEGLHEDILSHQIARSVKSFAKPLGIVQNDRNEKLSDLLSRASGQTMKVADAYFDFVDAGNDYRIEKSFRDVELFEASGRAITGKNKYTTQELFECLEKLGYEKVPMHKAVLYVMPKKRKNKAAQRIVYADLFKDGGFNLVPTIDLGYYDGRTAVSAVMCEMEETWFGRTMWVFQKKVR